MKSSATMSIGEIAGHFGLATHVLRHWESVGLLAPARGTGNQRRYGPGDLYRIAIILQLKEGGYGLDDICEMLATTGDLDRRRALLRRRRDELIRRIAEAQEALDDIEAGLNCAYEDITECPHFRSVIADRIGLDIPAGMSPHDLLALSSK